MLQALWEQWNKRDLQSWCLKLNAYFPTKVSLSALSETHLSPVGACMACLQLRCAHKKSSCFFFFLFSGIRKRSKVAWETQCGIQECFRSFFFRADLLLLINCLQWLWAQALPLPYLNLFKGFWQSSRSTECTYTAQLDRWKWMACAVLNEHIYLSNNPG